MSLTEKINLAAELVAKNTRENEQLVYCWLEKEDYASLKELAKQKNLKLKQLWQLILKNAIKELKIDK